MYAPFFHLLKPFAFLYAYYIPGSEKAPHPESCFRVGRLKFLLIYAKAGHLKTFFIIVLLLPSGIASFCS